jgi:hypothetical protein
MKSDERIAHPFQVPENFHEDFKSETKSSIEKKERKLKVEKFAVNFLKYAAVFVAAFMIGRYSINPESKENKAINMESIYNQVSEDDITSFIIENDLLSNL